MRGFSIPAITAASTIAFSQIACAADLPTKAPSLPPAPAIYNWTGWYIGGNAGGNWGKSNDSMTIANANPLFAPGFDAIAGQGLNTSGFTGGVQSGYNWQLGNFLLGVELDFEYFRSAGSQNLTFPTPSNPFFTSTLSKSVTTDWLFTARPRLGVVSGNWLFYGTGGLAVTELKASWMYADTSHEASNASLSTTKAGWTAGGGVETALPSNWLLGLEYLYVKFGNITTVVPFFFAGAPLGNITVTNSADLASNIIRIRLNKKF